MSGDDRERETLGLKDMKFDAEGLIPAVVQQHDTGEVLMVAWMNAESLARTCETRKTWFWSRSRQKYWMKGEESGNTQEVRELRYDCDADTLLVLVDAAGPACHTGESTCFYRSLCGEGGAARAAVTAGAGGAAAPRIGDVLDELFAVIESRRDASAEESYTAKLLQRPCRQAAEEDRRGGHRGRHRCGRARPRPAALRGGRPRLSPARDARPRGADPPRTSRPSSRSAGSGRACAAARRSSRIPPRWPASSSG